MELKCKRNLLVIFNMLSPHSSDNPAITGSCIKIGEHCHVLEKIFLG